MRADPKPQQAVRDFDCEGSMMQPNSRRPELIGLFEAERRMVRVCL